MGKQIQKNDPAAEGLEARRAEAMQERPSVAPLCDIYENESEVLLVADLPGVSSEGLELSFDKGQLTLEGHRRAETTRPVAAEFRPVDYRRTFVLPDGIDSARIAAELKAGVLHVHLPKAEPLKPRKIEVRGL